MTKVTGLIALLFIISTLTARETRAQADTPTVIQQVKAAVSAAPPNKRDGAKVLGYNKQGKLTTLRKGSNELICMADKPGDSKFHVACYYEGLEPFMKRGRELSAQGYSRSKVDSIRKVEIESDKLEYPRKPMALYSLTGPKDGYDYQAGKIRKANPLYVVYIPYATEKSTGISGAPASKGGSWLMEPGTPWAHIMFPGRSIEEKSENN